MGSGERGQKREAMPSTPGTERRRGPQWTLAGPALFPTSTACPPFFPPLSPACPLSASQPPSSPSLSTPTGGSRQQQTEPTSHRPGPRTIPSPRLQGALRLPSQQVGSLRPSSSTGISPHPQPPETSLPTPCIAQPTPAWLGAVVGFMTRLIVSTRSMVSQPFQRGYCASSS